MRRRATRLTWPQIDVHYSLPRPDEQNGQCDRDKNQVTNQRWVTEIREVQRHFYTRARYSSYYGIHPLHRGLTRLNCAGDFSSTETSNQSKSWEVELSMSVFLTESCPDSFRVRSQRYVEFYDTRVRLHGYILLDFPRDSTCS